MLGEEETKNRVGILGHPVSYYNPQVQGRCCINNNEDARNTYPPSPFIM